MISSDIADKGLFKHLDMAKDNWKKILKTSPYMKLNFEDRLPTPEENMKLWFNTEFFHLDKAKLDKFTRLKSEIVGGFSFCMLIDTLRGLFMVLDVFDKKVITEILAKEAGN